MSRLGRMALDKVETVVKKSKEQTQEATAKLKESFEEIIDGQNDIVKALVSIYELLDQNNDILRELSKKFSMTVNDKPKPHTDMTLEG